MNEELIQRGKDDEAAIRDCRVHRKAMWPALKDAVPALAAWLLFESKVFTEGSMRIQPRTSPETDRCMDLIQQLASVVVHELCVDVGFQTVTLTGRAGSWYAKQVATTAARRMYPNHRIENLLQVTTVR